MNKIKVTSEEREMCQIAPNSLIAECVQLRLAILRLSMTVNKDIIAAKSLIKRLWHVAKSLS